MGVLNSEIIGQKFGKLTVIEYIKTIKKGGRIFLCLCDCGNTREVRYATLNFGDVTHCGCRTQEQYEALTKDMTGQKIGKYIVIRRAEKPEYSTKKKTGAYWVCKCECGKINVLYGRDLRDGSTKSCGCDRAEQTAIRTRKYEPWYRSAKTVFKQTYSDGNLTMEDFLRLSSQNCFYCGVEPGNKYNVFTYDRATPFSLENGTTSTIASTLITSYTCGYS